MELVDVEEEGPARLRGLGCARQGHLVKLGDGKGAEERGVLLADRPGGELSEEDAALVRERAEVEARLLRGHHAPHEPGAQKHVEPREDRRLRAPADEPRELDLPEGGDVRIGDRREELLPEGGISEEAAQVEEGAASRALEEYLDRVPYDLRHLVAPGGREAPEDGHQVRREELPLGVGIGSQYIPADYGCVIRRIEEHAVANAFRRDSGGDFVDQVTVGIEHADAVAGLDVLKDHLQE